MAASSNPRTTTTTATLLIATAAAAAAAAALSAAGTAYALRRQRRRKGAPRRGRRRAGSQPGTDDDDDNDDDGDGEADEADKEETRRRTGIVHGVPGLIGDTPLMRIEGLSELTGCEILGKAEFLNPGGSPKDRVALQILLDAESSGAISPHCGDCIFEGTVGSTGISLATLCRAKGYRCSIVLPDDVAREKSELLKKLGAEVKMVRPRGIVDPRHFVNEARALAKAFGQGQGGDDDTTMTISETRSEVLVEQRGTTSSSISPARPRPRPRGFFADQFETPSNFLAHYRGTGPEIWRQCGGSERAYAHLDAFVAGAGTGGTLSGVSAALKEAEAGVRAAAASSPEDRPRHLRVVLADPQGSGLYNKVRHGVMYSHTEAEGTRRRHQVDTVVEGIGMNRITHNLSRGIHLVDDAVSVSDEQAVRMSRYLGKREGLFVGSSSAVNVVAAVKVAVRLKRQWQWQWQRERNERSERRQGAVDAEDAGGSNDALRDGDRPVVVTILCDSGVRHLSKFHNDEVLAAQYGIHVGARGGGGGEDADADADADPDVDISDILQG